jgi:hypothetical protein
MMQGLKLLDIKEHAEKIILKGEEAGIKRLARRKRKGKRSQVRFAYSYLLPI